MSTSRKLSIRASRRTSLDERPFPAQNSEGTGFQRQALCGFGRRFRIQSCKDFAPYVVSRIEQCIHIPDAVSAAAAMGDISAGQARDELYKTILALIARSQRRAD